MLRVQIPLERVLDTRPGGAVGVLAALSRRRSRVQIPSRALSRHGTQTWNRDEAQTFVGVGSNPSRATEMRTPYQAPIVLVLVVALVLESDRARERIRSKGCAPRGGL